MSEKCFHCDEPIPEEITLFVDIHNETRAMCCYGCQAVAEQIKAFGLDDYYRHRTSFPLRPDSVVPDELKQLTIFNNPQVQSEFTHEKDEYSKETKLIIEGINCPACVWLIESRISKLTGVKEISINYSTHRCRIIWQSDEVKLSDIFLAIIQLGYKVHPYNYKKQEQFYENERKAQLLRIAIAGLFGMQVMMIAIALYFGDASSIEQKYRIFFQWVSLLLTLPVLLFSGKPLFIGAFRDIKNKRPGMDVPITLGISIAFLSSLSSTIYQQGHVYYDSIVMFIFFILSGRYFEFMSHKKSIAHLDQVSSLLPLYVTRLGDNNKEIVELNALSIGDKILVKPGEVIPIDGIVSEGQSSVNESIITGESLPITKTINAQVIGGSTNIESPLTIEVIKVGEHTILSNIARIIDKASSNKPATVLLANRIVTIFISVLLVTAFLTALYWYHTDQTQWVAITIAVLVVSCPCALSLATPTALSSATTTFIKNGIALVNNDAIEKLAKITYFVFDKTGTLTKGELELENIKILNSNYNHEEILNIASALESASEHPIAKAINKANKNSNETVIKNIKNYPGQGISGEFNGSWFIGTEQFINKNCTNAHLNINTNNKKLRKVTLANSESIVACLYFKDDLRDTSKLLIDYLKNLDKNIILMSGDHESIVKETAIKLGIDNYLAELKPEDKLEKIAQLQKQGKQVCIIGDGINDAPGFAQADVAIAMTEASDITKLNADILLLNNQIDSIKTMLKIVQKTNQTIRVNFTWAVSYNLLALPVAIMGYIAPWMAALGMSLSSLVVVINATRIGVKNYN
ncbi:MAG: cadmium-translocating P-type ATPase [Proteobacteria bacterium]|nr:cadmium-translocating P-type ATPase [Pseudomonadota bacterium]